MLLPTVIVGALCPGLGLKTWPIKLLHMTQLTTSRVSVIENAITTRPPFTDPLKNGGKTSVPPETHVFARQKIKKTSVSVATNT